MQLTIGDEVWKPIQGLEDSYAISNYGRIKSLARFSLNGRNQKDRIIKLRDCVTITLGQKACSIDVLVAEAFIRPLKDYDCIIHLDGNTHNCQLDNLQIKDTNTMGVDFTDIPGFNGYQASRDGIIRRKPNKFINKRGIISNVRCLIMKPHPDPDGYLRTSATVNGKHMSVSVHRLVALTFIPNPENKPTVNHKNGNKLDNSVENLEWATQEEQNHHAIATGLREGTMAAARVVSKANLSKSVICVENSVIYPSMIEAERALNLTHSTVYESITQHRSVNGYTFFRCDENGDIIEDSILRSSGRGRQCRCKETGQIFKSCRAAAIMSKINRNRLRAAIESGRTVNGMTFEYI